MKHHPHVCLQGAEQAWLKHWNNKILLGKDSLLTLVSNTHLLVNVLQVSRLLSGLLPRCAEGLLGLFCTRGDWQEDQLYLQTFPE